MAQALQNNPKMELITPEDQGPRQVPGFEELPEDPKKQQKVEMVNNMITDMLYNPKTKKQVQDMIRSAPPELSIPSAVNTVFSKFESMSTEELGEIPLDIKLGAGVHLFSEIMELSEAMGTIPENLPQEQVQELLKRTIQKYVESGLKDGSIDPIELQQVAEPLLTEQERSLGNELAEKHGIPQELHPAQANMAMVDRAQRPLKLQNQQLQKQNKKMTGALQGIASAPPKED